MRRTWIRKWAALLCALALLNPLCGSTLAMTLVSGTPPGSSGPTDNTCHITLNSRTIGAGEVLFYETIAPKLASNPFSDAYYPCPLTVELTGQIVIESGGSLTIGTLSVGNEHEASPVIRGELSPGGLIVVKAGGRLTLKTATLDLSGAGLFLIQEPGGSVEIVATSLNDKLISWAPPTVDNAYKKSLGLWPDEGTVLTEELLPQTMMVAVQHHGKSRFKTLSLAWDLEDYNGQTEGELTLNGTFLNEDGEALTSTKPLTCTVRWIKPDALAITDTAWLGQTNPSATLTLKELPDDADEVWGEVSTDGGKSWKRWENFDVQRGSPAVAIFMLPDATPRLFRIQAANDADHRCWTSDIVQLPKDETIPSDQGGSRGGSTAIVGPQQNPTVTSPTPDPGTDSNTLPAVVQALLVLLGAAACALTGVLVVKKKR